tara:strand:- start:43 stop:492 length:450 start_codon:yes stop_codon:yes gene_type:complete
MITAFALFSTRRQEEITRIKWADLDADAKRIMVKDMKHPGDKAGNDVLCDLPDAACSIALSMPRNSAFIFPFSSDAISRHSRELAKYSPSTICVFTRFGTKEDPGFSKWDYIFLKLLQSQGKDPGNHSSVTLIYTKGVTSMTNGLGFSR